MSSQPQEFLSALTSLISLREASSMESFDLKRNEITTVMASSPTWTACGLRK